MIRPESKFFTRSLYYTLLLSILIWFQPAMTQQLEGSDAGSDHADFELVKSRHVAPEYPRRAVADGREGWVDLAITVNPDGTVSNVAVLAAEPRRVFERPAIRAAKKWKFKPPADSEISLPITRTFRVSFRLVE